MKFIQLRTALERAIPEVACQSSKQVRKESIVRTRERVENSNIKLKPVDRTAAIVTSKASWIHQPPIMSETKNDINTEAKMARLQDAVNESDAKLRVMMSVLTGAKSQQEEVSATTKTAETIVKSLWAASAEIEVVGTKAVKTLREIRVGAATEAETICRTLREVRQFFIGPDYHKEIERLEHFITLCERMQSLKESGMLEAVSDVMLKLACR